MSGKSKVTSVKKTNGATTIKRKAAADGGADAPAKKKALIQKNTLPMPELDADGAGELDHEPEAEEFQAEQEPVQYDETSSSQIGEDDAAMQTGEPSIDDDDGGADHSGDADAAPAEEDVPAEADEEASAEAAPAEAEAEAEQAEEEEEEQAAEDAAVDDDISAEQLISEGQEDFDATNGEEVANGASSSSAAHGASAERAGNASASTALTLLQPGVSIDTRVAAVAATYLKESVYGKYVDYPHEMLPVVYMFALRQLRKDPSYWRKIKIKDLYFQQYTSANGNQGMRIGNRATEASNPQFKTHFLELATPAMLLLRCTGPLGTYGDLNNMYAQDLANPEYPDNHLHMHSMTAIEFLRLPQKKGQLLLNREMVEFFMMIHDIEKLLFIEHCRNVNLRAQNKPQRPAKKYTSNYIFNLLSALKGAFDTIFFDQWAREKRKSVAKKNKANAATVLSVTMAATEYLDLMPNDNAFADFFNDYSEEEEKKPKAAAAAAAAATTAGSADGITAEEAAAAAAEILRAEREEEEAEEIQPENCAEALVGELYVQMCRKFLVDPVTKKCEWDPAKDTIFQDENCTFKFPSDFDAIGKKPVIPVLPAKLYPHKDAPPCPEHLCSVDSKSVPQYISGDINIKSKLFRTKPQQMPQGQWDDDFKKSEETQSHHILNRLADERKIDWITYPQYVGLSKVSLPIHERADRPGDVVSFVLSCKVSLDKKKKSQPGCTYFGLTFKKKSSRTFYRLGEGILKTILPFSFRSKHDISLTDDEVDKIVRMEAGQITSGDQSTALIAAQSSGMTDEKFIEYVQTYKPTEALHQQNATIVQDGYRLWGTQQDDTEVYLQSMIEDHRTAALKIQSDKLMITDAAGVSSLDTDASMAPSRPTQQVASGKFGNASKPAAAASGAAAKKKSVLANL